MKQHEKWGLQDSLNHWITKQEIVINKGHRKAHLMTKNYQLEVNEANMGVSVQIKQTWPIDINYTQSEKVLANWKGLDSRL